MASLLERVLRTGDKKTLKTLRNYADAINVLEDEFKGMSDAELRGETDRLKERYNDGESLDDLLPEAFAAVREAAGRTLGMRHFDVQLMGGAALHLGNIAEMKTGEGKTLVATAPAYLNALTGRGVHIVTVNDYLAEYQSDLMGRVFRFLGMTSGCILSNQDPATRRQQYAADITYGTNNEFGFDYLRDNMAWSAAELVQRGHHFAIVDEVDSILIDEARTPLIISGAASGDVNRWYTEFSKVVTRLTRETDYEVDEKKRTVGILEPGIEKVEDYLGISNLYEAANTPLIGFLNNAIKAKELFKRDKDYVVLNGEVMIVDEHTGRILAGRRYNEGMHQAIEAKEGVAIKAENQTLATVTLQNYFRLYEKLSGMTGTAETEAAEFMSTYKLGVVPIPTNKPMSRIDQSDLIYKNEVAKFDAVVKDIAERHASGQPVLVGTTSVEKSEYLSKQLAKAGIRHEVLNAKNHAREAAIIAQAGRKGAVTVATNMAGRGTDIMLGGNAEFNAIAELERRGLDPNDNPEDYEAAWPDALEKARHAVAAEQQEVVELGGLYVLGTERHESRRIDNQLRGRSGRQGDPGESRFYLSLTDDLMRLFNSGAAERIMNSSSMPDDVALESKLVSKAIQNAQGQVEGRNAEQRKNVLKYDDVLNRQREAIYGDRRRILEGDDLQEKISFFLEDVVSAVVNEATAEGHGDDWDLEQLWTNLKTLYPIGLTIDEVVDEAGGKSRLTREFLHNEILSDAKLAYQAREEALGSATMRELERRVVLSVIGRKWQEHLYEMDYLKEGIGLRAMAQRDPLVEYQREGFVMFQTMMESIREESIGYLFNADVQVSEPAAPAANALSGVKDARGVIGTPVIKAAGLEAPQQPASLQFSAPDSQGGVETRIERTASKGKQADAAGTRRAAQAGKAGAKKAKRRK
ncbi:preprotein translocase subunit SecA [Arthrobacter zhangbolii]|uniref:Protein translocase subunit SecA n=1 Tax=Arthrobacter zhangbolii TaxID=2886936 RepID=A0A9X1M9I9_9MICC|nr:preprotein translocase subunit SecA [Arthrobacter zhangbolii]MCC3274008.1 preprotein translocase subunit SecA [Arthrobacter zhangbolii]UON91263.1 preprotein translocase subunit SecA [Arthrobacter zhangbolii]